MKMIIVTALILLTACTSNYQAAKKNIVDSLGYSEIRINTEKKPEHYALRYQGRSSDTPALITQYWHQRAEALCPQGYQVLSHHQSIKEEPFKSPVNNMMMRFYRKIPSTHGKIVCKPMGSCKLMESDPDLSPQIK